MKRRGTRRARKAALPIDPIQQVLGDLFGEVQRSLFNKILPQTPMFQPTQQPEIKDAEVISIRTNK
jgi:hypothetical protein